MLWKHMYIVMDCCELLSFQILIYWGGITRLRLVVRASCIFDSICITRVPISVKGNCKYLIVGPITSISRVWFGVLEQECENRTRKIVINC